MRNKWRKFWILCAVSGGVGVLLLVIAMAKGVTWRDFQARFPDGVVIGSNRRGINLGSIGRGRERGSSSESFYDIENLDIEIGVARVELLSHEEDAIRVEVDGSGNNNVEYHDRNGTLYIETRGRRGLNFFSFGRGGNTPTIYIFLPSDIEFEEVDITVGAGELFAQDELVARDVNITVGAGELIADYGVLAYELNIEVGAGRVRIDHADFTEQASITSGAGEVTLTLLGAKEDYDFDLSLGVGRVVLGDSSHSGLGGSIELDHGQERLLEVVSGVGAVEVQFLR